MEQGAKKGWAQEANLQDCDTAINVHPEKLAIPRSYGEYVDRAGEVVQMSIVRAGIRLTGWLNLIYSGRTGF